MQGIVILIFEILMIIFYGIFIRTDSINTASLSSIDSSLFFIAAYAFLSLKNKNLDWSALINFLFVTMVVLQINVLYYYFWYYVFSGTFVSTTSLTSAAFVNGVQSTLVVVITISMFVSRLSQQSIFIIAMIQTFFFALNWGICRWGINAITSGGTITIWLFGLIFSACIKKMRYSELQQVQTTKYFTKSIQVISLVIMILFWPSFNQMTTVLDLTVLNLDSSSLIQQNAYLQTWLCLFSCIVTTLGLRISGQRMSLSKIIYSILNTGIFVSSSAFAIIDPFASILLGFAGPMIYFIYQKFGSILKQTGLPLDSIIMAILGGIMSSIFCGGRNGRTPALSSDPIRQGGLQFSALLVTILISTIFGLITGLIMKYVSSDDVQLTDMGLWQIQSQIIPLYPDDPKFQQLFKIQDKQRLHQQNKNFSLKQRYLSNLNS